MHLGGGYLPDIVLCLGLFFLWLISSEAIHDALLKALSGNSHDGVRILSHTQGFGSLGRDIAVSGAPLGARSKRFLSGLGTHTPSETQIAAPEGAANFTGECAVNAFACGGAQLQCEVLLDGEIVFTSPVLLNDSPAAGFNVSLSGAHSIAIRTRTAKQNIDCNHVDWGNLVFR
jgi:hypothetical protein